MPITSADIRKKALKNTLKVEHILWAARTPSLELAGELDNLASELGWQFNDGFPKVPWREWAFVVSEYCRGGYPRLVEVANDRRLLSFVCSLLVELRGDESFDCVLEIAGDLLAHPEKDLVTADEIASAMNFLCLSKPKVTPDCETSAKVREFLHRLLRLAPTDLEYAHAFCALRFFGDESSLDEITRVPTLAENWEIARSEAKRAIRKRLKDQHV